MSGNGASVALERPTRGRSWGAVGGLAALAFGMAGVLWQAFSAGLGPEGNVPVFVLVTLNGLTLAALYFIGASGFTLIFGLMRIPNLAHGAMFLLGGYVALRITQGGTSWWLAALVAMLATGALGLVVYLALLRWNLGQDVRQTLITIAVSVILADQMLSNFGATPEAVVPPPGLDQPVPLGLYGLAYPAFRLAVLVAALLIGAVMGLILRRTRVGIVVRAGVDDQAMTSAMGISISRVFAGAFFVGSALAGLGGAFGGTTLSLAPGQDQAFLVSSLVVVIIGGMGSLSGAALGALLLGLVDQYASAYLPSAYSNLSVLLTFVLLAVVLAVKPTGLFGRMR